MASQLKISMKRRRNVLKLVQKIEILDKLKSGDTVISLARKYGINEFSVQEIQKNEVTIRRNIKESTSILNKTCYITLVYRNPELTKKNLTRIKRKKNQ